jgi:hypothetical protein
LVPWKKMTFAPLRSSWFRSVLSVDAVAWNFWYEA